MSIRWLPILLATFVFQSHADSFRITRGIGVEVNTVRMNLIKRLFITDSDQLLTVGCTLPLHLNPWNKAVELYLEIQPVNNVMVIGMQHTGALAPRIIMSESLESYETCSQVVANLMTATVTSPVTLTVDNGGPVALAR